MVILARKESDCVMRSAIDDLRRMFRHNIADIQQRQDLRVEEFGPKGRRLAAYQAGDVLIALNRLALAFLGEKGHNR